MVKLKVAPAQLAHAPVSRIAAVPGDVKAHEATRRAYAPWRKWYNTQRWRDLRRMVLVRDGYKCRQTGALCTGRGNDAFAPVVDHIRPHRGDEALFWDPDNLQTVTKRWHDTVKQAQERADG